MWFHNLLLESNSTYYTVFLLMIQFDIINNSNSNSHLKICSSCLWLVPYILNMDFFFILGMKCNFKTKLANEFRILFLVFIVNIIQKNMVV